MREGDTVIACNPVMDFTSVPLTVGHRYTVLEVVRGLSTAEARMVVVTSDNGKRGIFDISRFKKDTT